ncbi:hypothetical protein DFQ01_112107 [Paenibacillus cellulosilyticus]|uniref:DUF6916 domain-containing protein n=2 Tax=Paenibacillus cellulosilyticus TaxID=375489 RepID=A0A2V2YRW8_9BACL|nr:hypothetical protein DFQ01_112107 [Paenibacillus cellulosilyticus]
MPTLAMYKQAVNTAFEVVGLERKVELTLAVVEKVKEDPGFERFTLLFDGPSDVFLPQQTLPLYHADLGELDIFVSPIGPTANGYRYEAIFHMAI